MQTEGELVDDIHFGLAKLILSEFDIILIHKMWDETKIQLKCNGLSNDTLPDMNRNIDLNMSHFPRLKEVLTEINQYDLRLYEYAQARAHERVRGCRYLVL